MRRPIAHHVFTWSRYFGFTPFKFEDDHLTFKWASCTTFYFIFNMIIAHSVFAFHFYVFVTESIKYELKFQFIRNLSILLFLERV